MMRNVDVEFIDMCPSTTLNEAKNGIVCTMNNRATNVTKQKVSSDGDATVEINVRVHTRMGGLVALGLVGQQAIQSNPLALLVRGPGEKELTPSIGCWISDGEVRIVMGDRVFFCGDCDTRDPTVITMIVQNGSMQFKIDGRNLNSPELRALKMQGTFHIGLMTSRQLQIVSVDSVKVRGDAAALLIGAALLATLMQQQNGGQRNTSSPQRSASNRNSSSPQRSASTRSANNEPYAVMGTVVSSPAPVANTPASYANTPAPYGGGYDDGWTPATKWCMVFTLLVAFANTFAATIGYPHTYVNDISFHYASSDFARVSNNNAQATLINQYLGNCDSFVRTSRAGLAFGQMATWSLFLGGIFLSICTTKMQPWQIMWSTSLCAFAAFTSFLSSMIAFSLYNSTFCDNIRLKTDVDRTKDSSVGATGPILLVMMVFNIVAACSLLVADSQRKAWSISMLVFIIAFTVVTAGSGFGRP